MRPAQPTAEQLRIAIENASDGLVVLDESNRVVVANEALHRLLGWESGALLGRSLVDLVPRDFLTLHDRQLREPGRHVERFDRGDGRTIEIENSTIGGDGGGGQVWIFRDVSDQERRRRDSDEISRRMAILHGISVATLADGGEASILTAAVDGLAARYPDFRAVFAWLRPDGRLELARERGRVGESREGRVVDLASCRRELDALLQLRILETRDVRIDARAEAFRPLLAAADIVALLRGVVHVDDAGFALVGLDAATPQTWSEEQRRTVEAVTEHLTVALADARERALRREAERALALRESEHRALLSRLSGMAYRCLHDAEWTIEYASEGSRRLTGWSAAELESGGNVRYADLIHPDDRAALWASRRVAVAAGVDFSNEYRIVTADAAEKWVWDQASAVRDAAGEILRIEGFITDVTDRRRAEAARAELKRVLQQAATDWARTFDAAESPIVLVDERSEVLRLNRAALELCSAESFREVHGVRLVDLGGGALFEEGAALVASVLATRKRGSKHVPLPVDGRHWFLTASPDDAPGEHARRVVLVFKDVTDTVALQASLRERELMAAMGRLVAGVSHEVRNPLFAISATLDAFEQELGERHEFETYLQILRKQVERMTSLMGELLEYGRPAPKPSGGRADGTARPGRELGEHRLDELVKAVADESRAPAFERGCTVVFRGGGGNAAAGADALGLRSVVQNLLDNALQHSAPGGEVVVATAVETNASPAVWTLTIDDGGPGFREEDLPRLFEPFFSRRRGGTGMGLAIVRKIVLEHGGDVTLANRPGGGARARVELPVTRLDA